MTLSSVKAVTVTSSPTGYFLLCFCLAFLSNCLLQMLLRFCFLWQFLSLSKLVSGCLFIDVQCQLPSRSQLLFFVSVISLLLLLLASSLSLLFVSSLFWERFFTLFAVAYKKILLVMLPLWLSVLCLLLLSCISHSVFSLLCLKQREQWTWCPIMQISSGLIWKQHISYFCNCCARIWP